jgi:hypothetical protein
VQQANFELWFQLVSQLGPSYLLGHVYVLLWLISQDAMGGNFAMQAGLS